MDKIEQLFVRACKSENSERRLLRLYKAFYLGEGLSTDTLKEVVISILSAIHFKYCKPLEPYKIYAELSYSKYVQLGDSRDIQQKMFDFLVTEIAITKASSFEGLIAPLRLRK